MSEGSFDNNAKASLFQQQQHQQPEYTKSSSGGSSGSKSAAPAVTPSSSELASKSSTSASSSVPFETILVNDGDVICGRGKMAFHHAGNVRFREQVAKSVEMYKKAEKRLGKPVIVQSIIDSVYESGGRFLKRDPKLQLWVELNLQQQKDKVSHAIRDASKEMQRRKLEDSTRKLARPGWAEAHSSSADAIAHQRQQQQPSAEQQQRRSSHVTAPDGPTSFVQYSAPANGFSSLANGNRNSAPNHQRNAASAEATNTAPLSIDRNGNNVNCGAFMSSMSTTRPLFQQQGQQQHQPGNHSHQQREQHEPKCTNLAAPSERLTGRVEFSLRSNSMDAVAAFDNIPSHLDHRQQQQQAYRQSHGNVPTESKQQDDPSSCIVEPFKFAMLPPQQKFVFPSESSSSPTVAKPSQQQQARERSGGPVLKRTNSSNSITLEQVVAGSEQHRMQQSSSHRNNAANFESTDNLNNFSCGSMDLTSIVGHESFRKIRSTNSNNNNGFDTAMHGSAMSALNFSIASLDISANSEPHQGVGSSNMDFMAGAVSAFDDSGCSNNGNNHGTNGNNGNSNTATGKSLISVDSKG